MFLFRMIYILFFQVLLWITWQLYFSQKKAFIAKQLLSVF